MIATVYILGIITTMIASLLLVIKHQHLKRVHQMERLGMTLLAVQHSI